ncbi:hypothetical protein [Microbacterium sp. C7(2022)]|uniref:hypothetical protein n=1 Tax=Microbacterium sp. C7(2022) TaxID=2992759 RepID=UPI00237A77F5|nr:hypothetical protein [Microbacterium sp. C7(2022)]MDE0545172.1 hypothetical protein [Microbacterium sp. C7(2022)]
MLASIMADVEFRHSDFIDAVAHLRESGAAHEEAFCPAFGVLGSARVEAALVDVDGVVRAAMAALAERGDQLAVSAAVVHSELKRLDSSMAGAAE